MKASIVTAALVVVSAASGAIAQPLLSTEPTCDVTVPNGVVAGTTEPQRGSHGNALLSVGPFGLWAGGTVVFKPGGAGFVLPDGALSMKFGWMRAIPGKLNVSGRRIDSEAPALRSDIPCCYDATGFQASALIFPTPGCWEVSALIGDRQDSKLTFVTKVVQVRREAGGLDGRPQR
jgi:hypothetical protein